ncbi:WD repeat-containing protein 13-like [Amphibalanus amphitrite]|uniref:WD repeat-containing protein 13-like n=1 Tax=Amphibalanus amphitrite TaxID=1232801 RepID=UPI001C901EFC|nr:WD repeat-containing protein 13-like [Amphibalanus amphitrite]
MTVWQQILALDARFNAHRVPADPGFRTLYIRRRSQLLREGVREEAGADPALRRQYLRQRAALLSRRYGVPADQVSVRSHSASTQSHSRQSHSRHHSDVGVARRGGESPATPGGGGTLVPSARATASQAIVGGGSLGENYAFAGFLHVFDQHTGPVTCVQFAHDELWLLALGSLDGRVSVCELEGEPRVRHLLSGHTDGVTALAWSTSNELLVTCARDGTARLWQPGSGHCLRAVADPHGSPLSCVVFHPENNNLVLLGNRHGLVQAVNVSSGRFPAGGSSQLASAVTALAAPPTGALIWAGCQKGMVVSFQCDQASGRLVKCRRVTVSDGVPVTCISARSWASREAADMSLLVNAACNSLLLFRVVDQEGGLQLKRRFSVRHSSAEHVIKSSFCPIMSFRQGACVVSGSEDCTVYLFDVERDLKPCVNKLQGHSAAVLDVSFNRDESLLATGDASGIVIVWKRQLSTTESA